MSILSVLKNITHGYSPAESALFDRFAAAIAAPLWTFAFDHIEPELRPGMRVLDVGCGGGQFALQLAERVPEIRIVGVDLSPEQIARARARVGALHGLQDRVSFLEANALALPFAKGEFDLVYSLGSIKHWPERGRGLHECARVLVPGAFLWVIEGDRGCRIADVRALISTWNLPAPLHPLAIAFFRDVVAGNSLDVDEARTLLASISILDGSVERGGGLPLWMITGRRRADVDD